MPILRLLHDIGQVSRKYTAPIIIALFFFILLVSGKIGLRNVRLDFTVIGDTVNLAARLKSYAEVLPGSAIPVSEEMRAAVADSIKMQLESEVQLKGKSLQTRVYRIV